MSIFNWCKSEEIPQAKEVFYQMFVVYKINGEEHPYSLETEWLRNEMIESSLVEHILCRRIHKQIMTRTYNKFEYQDIKSVEITHVDTKIIAER